jgi:hypothetical protein
VCEGGVETVNAPRQRNSKASTTDEHTRLLGEVTVLRQRIERLVTALVVLIQLIELNDEQMTGLEAILDPPDQHDLTVH